MAKHVLVIEDDHACETVLRRTIRSVDPQAEVLWEESAENGLLAIEHAHTAGQKIDLIIADIILSGNETGIELWRACRERYPDIPVLITSSMSILGFFDLVGRKTVAPPFMPKPFYIGECQQIIGSLLDRAS